MSLNLAVKYAINKTKNRNKNIEQVYAKDCMSKNKNDAHTERWCNAVASFKRQDSSRSLESFQQLESNQHPQPRKGNSDKIVDSGFVWYMIFYGISSSN